VRSTRSRDLRTLTFFLTANSISWAAWITLFARHLSPFVGIGRWLYLAAVCAPHGSAVMITAIVHGRAGLRAFYRLTFRRVPFRWVIIAISTPPIVYLIRDAIAVVFHRAPRFVLSLSTKDFNGTDLRLVSCRLG
jgi:hypothetical protein